MPYARNTELPPDVRNALPSAAQSVFRGAFNSAMDDGSSETDAFRIAWGAVRQGWKKGDDGKWVKKMATFERTFPICKVQEDEQIVWGWGYITRDPLNRFVPKAHTDADGFVVDHSGEQIDIDELEKAMYRYVIESREGDTGHTEKVTATLVEQLTITPAKKALLGLPDTFPEGTLIGYKVTDEATWKDVKAGKLPMFSLFGSCTREEV